MAAEFCLSVSLSYMKGSLTCSKILRNEADSFCSPSKEGVLRTFITLKVHRCCQGLSPRALGPMESTITTRPPRETKLTSKSWNWLQSLRMGTELVFQRREQRRALESSSSRSDFSRKTPHWVSSEHWLPCWWIDQIFYLGQIRGALLEEPVLCVWNCIIIT
jgi:hypothetical protein